MAVTPGTRAVEITQAAANHYRVSGALTFGTARRACEAGIAAFASSLSKAIEVDLSQVTASDSAGLAVVLFWLSWSLRTQRRLTLNHLPDAIRAMARISEVESLIERPLDFTPSAEG